jgi:hypothetical protein
MPFSSFSQTSNGGDSIQIDSINFDPCDLSIQDLREIRADLIRCSHLDSLLYHKKKEAEKLREEVIAGDLMYDLLKEDNDKNIQSIDLLQKQLARERKKKMGLSIGLGTFGGIALTGVIILLLVK